MTPGLKTQKVGNHYSKTMYVDFRKELDHEKKFGGIWSEVLKNYVLADPSPSTQLFPHDLL